ncbi:MAG: hypothetical protein GX151_03035 [Gammaproteobacteria bacterium]|jgi:hypothetical protein|nr:hypothetical protein [Gammaproteobacteria bacterium]
MIDQVLDAPAQVGSGTFHAGAKWSTVIAAAKRNFIYTKHDKQHTQKTSMPDCLDAVDKLSSGEWVLVPKELDHDLADRLASLAFDQIAPLFYSENRGEPEHSLERLKRLWIANKVRSLKMQHKFFIETAEASVCGGQK